ncbi:diguanylate cyclase [Paraburkholderia sp. LEh10]|uniref:diguanylate cyclase domain-containing protein n=1 Tax=Paraburkholderia sp. LEh10 TaxID=2821353 RepID=UPI001AEABCBA|nr:diguanylate cyclase [Paraburkholderia sp. LEh10]
MTGLVNRREFERQLADHLSVCRHTFSCDSTSILLYVDLDRFKMVNDTCGHAAGDRMLVEIALLMGHCLSGNDTLVSRVKN